MREAAVAPTNESPSFQWWTNGRPNSIQLFLDTEPCLRVVVLAIMDSLVVRKSVIESHITAKLVEYLLQSF